MNNGQPKRHHTVPQQYLLYFANEKEEVLVFDKITGRHHSPNVTKACVEKDFYRASELMVYLNEDRNLSEIDVPFLENTFFGRFENDLKLTLKDVVHSADKGIAITPELKKRLAIHVVMQWYRTSRYREHCVNFPAYKARELQERFKGRPMPEKVFLEFMRCRRQSSRSPKNAHIGDMLTPGLYVRSAMELLKYTWLLERVRPEWSFFTSDNPVATLTAGMPLNYHIADPSSSIIVFPLTPTLLLSCHHPDFLPNKYDCKFAITAESAIRRYNWVQYQHSKRQIIIQPTMLDWIQKLHGLEPKLRMKFMETGTA